MGMNFYLIKRNISYNPLENTPGSWGCSSDDKEDGVTILTNGYLWHNTYYATVEDLNKVFYQRIHIGKSSLGWHFGLAIYPDIDIIDLDSWKELFADPNNTILDEEDRLVSPDQMLDRITNRAAIGWNSSLSQEEYEKEVLENYNEFSSKMPPYRLASSYDELLVENSALRGSKGLWKRTGGGIMHPADPNATYDYIISGNDSNRYIIFS